VKQSLQVEVFWVVTPFSVAVGYQCFGGPCCLHSEDGDSRVLRNTGILLQHYTVFITQNLHRRENIKSLMSRNFAVIINRRQYMHGHDTQLIATTDVGGTEVVR